MNQKTLRERLEQYIYIPGEIKDLEKKKQEKVSAYFKEDFVEGCLDEYPYIKQKIKVDGYSIPAWLKSDLSEIDNEIENWKEEKREIEGIVDSIANMRTRRIIRQRYIYGLKLAEIPAELGHWESCDSVKWVIRNFFRNTPETPKTPETV